MTLGQLRSLILIGNLGAAAGLCGVGAQFLWRKVVTGPERVREVKIPKTTVQSADKGRTRNREDFRNTWTLPLVPDQQPRPERAADTAGPRPTEGMTAEKLRAKLAETFELRLCNPDYSNPGELSYAALTLRRPVAGKAPTVVVKINEEYFGMEVVDILPSAVLFEYQGARASLDFVGDAANAILDSQGGDGTAAGNEFAGGQVIDAPSGSFAWVTQAKQVTETGGLVVWEVSDEERTYLRRNYQRLLSEVKVVPHKGKDGKTDGLELTEIDPTSIVAKRGFEARDVVKSINGEPVTDMAKLPALFRKHRDAGELVVVYERRGVERTTTYKIPTK